MTTMASLLCWMAGYSELNTSTEATTLIITINAVTIVLSKIDLRDEPHHLVQVL